MHCHHPLQSYLPCGVSGIVGQEEGELPNVCGSCFQSNCSILCGLLTFSKNGNHVKQDERVTKTRMGLKLCIKV